MRYLVLWGVLLGLVFSSSVLAIEPVLIGIPGDADANLTVNLDDFVVLKQNFGSGSSWAEGDFDLDGDVDLDDFVLLKKNFGQTWDFQAELPDMNGDGDVDFDDLDMAGAVYGTYVYPPGDTLLYENFEATAVGAFPGGWVADANAVSDPGNNQVVVDPATGIGQVLKLFGSVGGCWGGLAFMPVDLCPEFSIRARIYNGDELLSGCHPARAVIQLRQGTSWTNPGSSLLWFHGDGTLIGVGGTDLGTYETERWYDVRVDYYRSGSNMTVHYWLDDEYLGVGNAAIDDLPVHLSMDHIGLVAYEGSAYFDDVVVLPVPTLLNEDFESSSVGAFPDGWIADANAASSPSNNQVVVDPVAGTGQVLKLFGVIGGCWGALAYAPAECDQELSIRSRVYNGSEPISGCHPQRAVIGIRQGTSWTNPGLGIMVFNGDGRLYGVGGTDLGAYESERWYDVRMDCSWSVSDVAVHYWLDDDYLGVRNWERDERPIELMDHVALTAYEGTVCFDDVVVLPVRGVDSTVDTIFLDAQAYFRLDEVGDMPVVDIAGSYDGSVVGTVTRGLEGALGNAYEFEAFYADYGYGTPGFVETSVMPSQYATVSFWVYPIASGGVLGSGHTTDGGKDGWSWHVRATGEPSVFTGQNFSAEFWKGNQKIGTVETEEGSLSSNEWSHVVVAVDDTIVSVYINGVFAASGQLSESPDTHDRGLLIGRNYYQGGGANSFGGRLDEVVVWDRILTSEEIGALWRYGRN